MAKRVVVLGASFAGLTAAFDIKRLTGDASDVTVVSSRDRFVFVPSLIWVVSGDRNLEDVSFELAPAFQKKNINFVHAAAQRIDPDEQKVYLAGGSALPYDFLFIGTGAHLDFDAIPGLGPQRGFTHSVCTIEHALQAQKAWSEFLQDPGPIVVGAAQGASCFGAAYEVVLNLEYALRKAGLRDRATVSFFTSEPYLGHFGLGGMDKASRQIHTFFRRFGIRGIPNVAIEEVSPDAIRLSNGVTLSYKYAVVIPPFLGVEAVRNSPGIGNEAGWVPVNENYQHPRYPNIYAGGVAVAVAPFEETPIPTGVPKTGYMSEVMGRVAGHNIAAQIKGQKPKGALVAEMGAMCILDAGNTGMVIMLDKIFGKRNLDFMLPGFFIHWGKLLFETYFIWKASTGKTYLP